MSVPAGLVLALLLDAIAALITFAPPRKLPCSSQGSDWSTPSVPPSVSDVFLNGNWSMSDPSPSCQCSTPEHTRMLPDCPPSAGGLPPPQVRPPYHLLGLP